MPRVLRDAVTDYLEYLLRHARPYRVVVPRIAAALERTGSRRVIDLCSGGGGPWSWLIDDLPRGDVEVVLTDLYPNLHAEQRGDERVRLHPEPVDATAVPEELTGFRTVFTAFHHFRPPQARAILEDAVERREGIAVFEVTQRSLPVMAGTLLLPLAVGLMTPGIRPLRLSRLLLTYVVPAIPFVILFDGMVSNLRTYSVEELRGLVEGLDDYAWEIGEEPVTGQLAPVTYLIGVPR